MKKVITLLIMFLTIFSPRLKVGAYDIMEGTDIPAVRYVKRDDGDKICFRVVVKEAETSTIYRTVGWVIGINEYKIIYKYPETAEFDFSFKISDIEKEFKRQAGECSSIYNSVKRALYETGGIISFDAINIVVKDGKELGGIKDNPVYGKAYSYNYTGEVYTTLNGIQNAANWGYVVKNIDLPKYFGIYYKFSEQPHINARVTLKFKDINGNEIGPDKLEENTFAKGGIWNYTGRIADIKEYIFEKWEITDKNGNTLKNGKDYFYDCILDEQISEVFVTMYYKPENNGVDLYISGISNGPYKGDTEVITIVKLVNRGNKDFDPENMVSIKFEANEKIYTRNIDIGAGKEIIIPFKWKTPESGIVTLKAEVNYEKKHWEIDYDNNKYSLDVKIEPYIWKKILDTPKIAIIPAPKPESISYREWEEWRFEKRDQSGKAIYERKKFWVKLNMTISLDKSKMKSGYGFYINAKTSIDTNYDRPEFIIAPQRIKAYLPETEYRYFTELEAVRENGFTTEWAFYNNIKSVFGYRKHYIPVWFPDNVNYVLSILADDAYSPGGALYITEQPDIYVDGNMYEDDVTGEIYI